MIDEALIRARFEATAAHLDERRRRLFVAAEALHIGYGGIAAVARATGVAVSTIGRGLKDLAAAPEIAVSRVRRDGGGRKSLTEKDPTLMKDLLDLVLPNERGDPESPLRWTCKSLRNLQAELLKLGHKVSFRTVGKLLKELGFSLQANSKTREGADHEDRDAQFAHINQKVTAALAENQPVISVDAKKKELVGDFKNNGREWRAKGSPEEVRVHDFMIKELGRVTPYGVYDLADNSGWVSVGVSSDTAEFAVASIRGWWRDVGCIRYPLATRLVITADGGGSNGSRVRLWKLALQRLSDELGIAIEVHHLPPGTSKWNKIEHRLFSFISMNWRAKPLVSYQVIIDLIASTTTKTGLTVQCVLDTNEYAKGVTVSDAEMAALNIERDPFHGEWNYTFKPSAMRSE
jgi:transposase